MKKVFGVFILFLIFFKPVLAKSEADLFSIENEFIKIIVNNENFDKGRFAVETTGGNPDNINDNNKSLIYGRPKPWTSYTTVQIDGTNYIFGGETKKRAGKNGIFGKFISQRIQNEEIVTKYKFEQIEVCQKLGFKRNPATKVKDATEISYEIKNLDDKSHKIGIRIMLDTMLGENDGAPFRIGNEAIEAENAFSKTEILDYWQAFDNLATPNVIAQGHLRSLDLGIYAPDRMYLVNWGTLADNAWEFNYEKNRTFIREGENEKDTALALYWEPKTVEPNNSTININTLYGLGGISVSAGALSLGLTAPTELYASAKPEILFVGYIYNNGGFDSKNTRAKFILPKGFSASNNDNGFNIGNLKAGESKQIALKTFLDNISEGDKVIKFKVESDTLEANEISRTITIFAPAKINATLVLPKENIASYNPFIIAKVLIKNPGEHVINNVSAKIILPKNLTLPFFEIPSKTLAELRPKQSQEISWYIKIDNPQNTHKYKIKTQVMSGVTDTLLMEESFLQKYPQTKLYLEPAQKMMKKDGYNYLWLKARWAKPEQIKNIIINFDKDKIKYLGFTSDFSVSKNILIKPTSESIYFEEIKLPATNLDQHLGKIYLKALQKGNTDIFWHYENRTSTENISIQIN